MRIIKLLLLPCVMLLMAVTSQVKGWRGIVPLHSTRADVERLLGKPNANYGRYEFENEQADILYSDAPCTAGLQGMWNVPRDTVISIRVTPKERLRLPDLRLDPSKYERVRDPLVQTHTYYMNREEGVRYVVFEGGREDNGKVLDIYYEPSAMDTHLQCPSSTQPATKSACSRAGRLTSNIPIGDPCPTIEIVSSSSDACQSRQYSFKANLGGIDPRFSPTYKWSLSAGTIISGQGTSSIVVDGRGASDKSLTVTLDVGGVIQEGCSKVESYTIECPKP